MDLFICMPPVVQADFMHIQKVKNFLAHSPDGTTSLPATLIWFIRYIPKSTRPQNQPNPGRGMTNYHIRQYLDHIET